MSDTNEFGAEILTANCVVVSSALMSDGCYSASRAVDDCKQCDRAARCTLHPSHVERLRVAVARCKAAKKESRLARLAYNKCLRESMEAQDVR